MEFINLYARLIIQFFANIFTFLKEILEAIVNILFFDLANYFKELFDTSKTFTWFDWLLLFLSIIFYTAAITFIIRYLRKHRLKTRFIRLSAIDLKYEEKKNEKTIKIKDDLSLREIVSRFRDFSATSMGLYYDKKVISTFFAGMATSKIIILEGISGTGKTSLPYAMGKFLKSDARIIPVQPSWRDRSEMIGYLNEFTKQFNETDFLEAVYETTYNHEKIHIIVLDELNLARIEYYFADFLSILELPEADEWNIHIVSGSHSGDPEHIINGKIRIPQNVWFAGTANLDDSTYTITDKVYDRAIPIIINSKAKSFVSIESPEINVTHEELLKLFAEAKTDYPVNQETLKKLEILDEFVVKNFKFTFGNRILKQAMDFIPVFVACGQTELEGLDYIFARKILRKLEGLNLSFFQKEIKELIKLIQSTFGMDEFIESISYLESYLKKK